MRAAAATCRAETDVTWAFDDDDPLAAKSIAAVVASAGSFPVSARTGPRQGLGAWTNEVAVASMAETGDGEPVLALEAGGEVEQVLEPAARHDDVLVELGEAGVAQGVGELAADLPDGFALLRPQPGLDEKRFLGGEQGLELANLPPHGAGLAVEFNNEVGAATAEAFAAGALERGSQSKRIGQLQRRGQKPGGENGVQRPDGGAH